MKRLPLARQRQITVRQLFERWVSVELKPQIGTDGRRRGRKDSGGYTRQQFERRVFPAIGNVPIEQVRKADIMAILDAAKSDGKLRTANVLLSDLKQMLRFAQARELISTNPVITLTKRDAGGKTSERQRFLTDDEIRALSAQIPAARLAKRSIHALWLILATGCRISELMGASWEHIDLKKKSWHLPQTKNQRPHTIALSAFAVTQFKALDALREADNDGKLLPWAFPNRRGTGILDVKTLGKQIADRQRPTDQKLRRRTKKSKSLALSGGRWTAHDLRRTAATIMARLGVSTDVIDECLNHMLQRSVSRVYIRDRREADQTIAFEKLGAELQRIIVTAVSGNVLPFKARAS